MNYVVLVGFLALPIIVMVLVNRARRRAGRVARRIASLDEPPAASGLATIPTIGFAVVFIAAAGFYVTQGGGFVRQCDTWGGRYRVPLGEGWALDAYRYRGGDWGAARLIHGDTKLDGDVKRLGERRGRVVAELDNKTVRMLEVRTGREVIVPTTDSALALLQAQGVPAPALFTPPLFHEARCTEDPSPVSLIIAAMALVGFVLSGLTWVVAAKIRG